MQRIISLLLLVFAAITLTSGKNDLLQFDEKKFDFGSVFATGGKVVHEFRFTNVSDDAVAVLSVSSDCECTKVKYPVEPLAPGESAVIEVTFNPERIDGRFDRNVTVRYRGAKARSSKRVTLRFSGVVARENNR